MESPNTSQPFRYLDLPVELRDDINELAIIDIPLPKHIEGLPYILRPSKITKRDLAEGKLHTNILLANRRVFEGANNTILRRAQLVNVTVQGQQLCHHVMRVLAGSRTAVLPAKYRSFCVFKHEMRDSRLDDHQDAAWEFVICGRDIDQFCRGLMGDVHWFFSEPVDRATSHTFTLLSPKDGLGAHAPAFSVETKVQEQILKPYQTHLRGFQNVSIGTTLPNKIDRNLKTAMMGAIKQGASYGPAKFSNEIIDLTNLAIKMSSKDSIPLAMTSWARSLTKFYSFIGGDIWFKLKQEGGASYAKSIAELWYEYIVTHTSFCTDLIYTITKLEMPASHVQAAISPYLLAVGAAYSFSLRNATLLRIPGWKPDPETESRMNYKVALSMRLGGMAVSGPIGYGAIRRAMEISPDDEDIQMENQEYQVHHEFISRKGWDTLTAGELRTYVQAVLDSHFF